MTENAILQHLVSKYPDLVYLWGFGWYKKESSGYMVQIPTGFLEHELLQTFFDDKTLNFKQISNAIKLFEILHSQDGHDLIGKYCFANEQQQDRFLSRINIPLDPSADTGPCLKWCNEVYPHNDLLLAQVGGYILFHPDNSHQRVFLITGPGGNGKGTFLRILTSILEVHVSGMPLACSVDFDEFGKHERVEIIGKQLVYDADISGNAKTQRWVKMLSGDDRITGSKKFKQAITFKPTCKLLLLSNPVPDWQNNPALLRRIVLLRFRRKFKIDPKHEERLLTQEMLTRWIAWFWHGYHDFLKHGFRLVEENHAGEFLSEVDDLSAFLQDWCTFGDQYDVPAPVVYREFVRYWNTVLQDTRSPQNARVLGKRLKELGIEKVRNQTLDPKTCQQYGLLEVGKRYDVYKGITLNDYV